MRRAGSGEWAALANVMLFVAATTAVRPVLTYRAIEVEASAVQIGVIATSYALMPVLIAFVVGRQIDHHGPHRYVLGGNVVFIAGIVTALSAASLVVLYLAAALLGLGQFVAALAQQAIAAQTPPAERDRAFGWLTAAAALGQAAGPAALAATPTVASRLDTTDTVVGLNIGLALGLLGLSTVWVMWRSRVGISAPIELPPEPARGMAWRIARTGGMWQALVAGAITMAAVDLLSAFLPLWASERGVSVATVGLLLALRGLFTLTARLLTDRMIPLLGRRTILGGSLAAAAGGLALLPLVGVSGAVAIMAILGVGLGLAQPLTMSWLTIVTAPGTRAAALGIRQAVNRVAQAILPGGIAAITLGNGAAGIFWGTALLLSGASAILIRAPMGDNSTPT